MLPACMGGSSNGLGAQGGNSSPLAAPSARTLLRLNVSQYNNTVRDLLGDTTQPATGSFIDERVGPFTSNSLAGVSTTTVQALQTLAQGVAARAVTNMDSLMACDSNRLLTDSAYETNCVNAFVVSFGGRAFRRPLDADEVTDFTTLYAQLRTNNTQPDSTAGLVTAFLQNPFFLYRPETTDAANSRDYAMATRLSYFLWDSMPDGDLLAAAAASSLHTQAQVAAQAQRMLADAKSSDTLHRFHREWLGVDTLPAISKSTTLYPQYTPALVASMQGETDHFVDALFASSAASFTDLLTAPYSYVDGRLATLYGLPAPTGDANAFSRATFTATSPRKGMVTQAGFLAVHAHEDQSDIVHRGLFVRSVLLCQNMPSPPNNVVIMVPALDPNTTTKQRQEQHRANAACSGCHALMDPLGTGFENYDAIGQYRTQDGRFPVDPSGALSATDVNGPTTNALNMMDILAQSTEVRQCYARQWLRFALGRDDTAADSATLTALYQTFAASQWDIKALMIATATSAAMMP